MDRTARERFQSILARGASTPPAAPAKPTIKRVSYSHEAIARWMIANPQAPLGDCAQQFGYSRSWLSIIIHSDAFQAKYAELSASADAAVIHDIPAKMRGAASLALDGLAEQIEDAVNDRNAGQRDFLLKTSESLLTKLGYGNKSSITVQANGQGAQVAVVEAGALNRARTKLAAVRQPEKEVEGEPVGLPNPAT